MDRLFLLSVFVGLGVTTAAVSQGQVAPTLGAGGKGTLSLTAPAAAKPVALSPSLTSLMATMPKSEWALDLAAYQANWALLQNDEKVTFASLNEQSQTEIQQLSATLQKKLPRATLIQTSLNFAAATLKRAALIQMINDVKQGVLEIPGREKELASLPSLKESPDALRLRATNLYRRLVTEYGKLPELEAGVLELCQQLTRQRNDNAEFYFREYFRAYQSTPLAKKALLAYGDFLIQTGKFDQAFASYKVVISDKKSEMYPYALLRYGWASMVLAMQAPVQSRDPLWKRAEVGLKVALKQLPEPKPDQKSKDRNLWQEGVRREAFRALALMYGERSQLTEAQKVLSENGGKEWINVAKERLADRLYSAPSSKPDALALYTELAADASFVRSPFVKLKVMDALGDKSDWVGAQAQVTELQSFLKNSFAAWQPIAKRWGEDPSALETRFEDILHKVAKQQLELQKAGDKTAASQPSLAAAFELQFPRSTFQDELTLDKSLIALKNGDLKGGVDGLDKFVGLQTEMTPLLKEVAMRRVLAMDQWIKQQPQPELPQIGKATKPVTLPTEQKNFLRDLQFFADAYPDDPSAPMFRKVIAFTYMSFGHYDKAVQCYEDLAYQYPENPLAKESLETIFGLLIEQAHWQDVVTKAEGYLSSKHMAPVGLRRKMRESIQYAKEQLQANAGTPVAQPAAD